MTSRLVTKVRYLPNACPRGHAYTEENTTLDPVGTRRCRVCRRMREAGYRQAKKAAKRAAA